MPITTNDPQHKTHQQSLYTTRTNKASSTISFVDPLKMQLQPQQQSESMLTNRLSHRKYKLSHSQITKIDKLSRQGLLRWKESRESQDDGQGNNINNNNNCIKNKGSINNLTKSRKSLTINNNSNSNRNSRQKLQQQHEQQKEIQKRFINNSKTIAIINGENDNNNDNLTQNPQQNKDNNKNKNKDKTIQQSTLKQITQNTTSMHSIVNYKLKKDKLVQLLDRSMTLHVQVIEFDLGKQRHCVDRNDSKDRCKVDEEIFSQQQQQQTSEHNQLLKFKNFQQHQLYQSRKLQQKQQKQQQKSQTKQNQPNIIQVICFQIHNKHTNMHYRSQFTYKTLGKDIKFVFENIDELFQYVTDGVNDYGSVDEGFQQQYQKKQQNSIIMFNQQTMELQIEILFMRGQKLQSKKSQKQQSSKPIVKKKKIIKIPLLPFAMIEIIEHHPHQLQQEKQKKQLLLEIKELKRDLELSRNLVHALRDENDKLKQRVNKEKIQAEKEKAEKEMIIESYQKLSKASQVPNKEYYFQFVPDMKAKNFNNFMFKSNILKKVKNDLKWDQVSSQAPLPKAGRHYFSFLIKDFLPDFMFGIVTMKGKDTSNAFLGLQTICLYASKNNCYIYERGKHYKISVSVKRNDIVFVIIDRQKNVIEWVKKKSSFGNGNSKQGSPKNKDYQKKFQLEPHMDHNTSLASITPQKQQLPSRHTQDDMPIQNPHYQHNNQYHHRKTSQTISSTQFPINQLSAISILPLTTAVDYPAQQIDYIHSTILPEEMVQKELYGYLEVYNVNQPLKLNDRK